jgi:hypothetical protein
MRSANQRSRATPTCTTPGIRARGVPRPLQPQAVPETSAMWRS